MIVILVLVILVGFLSYKALELPGVAIVGLYCMFGIEQWAQSQSVYFVQQSAVINIIIGIAAVIALSVKLYKSRILAEPYPLANVLVVMLFAYAFLSTTWTHHSVDTVALWQRAGPYIVLLLLVAPLLIAEPRDFARIFSWQIVVGGLFATMIVLGADYEGRKIVLGDGETEGGNPLAIAQMAGVTIICAIMMKRLFAGDYLVKIAIAIVCVIAIVKSGSRGQLIGLTGALLLAYPFRYSIRNPKVFVVSAIAEVELVYVAMIVLDTYWAESGRWTGQKMASDYEIRIDRSSRVLSAWFANPGAILFGLGNSASFNPSIIGHYPHIVPVEILCEEGIIGATIYVWILFLFVRDSISMLRRSAPDDDERSTFSILFGIAIYLFILSLKQGNLLGVTQFFMTVMLLSKAAATVRIQDRALARVNETESEPASNRPRTGIVRPIGYRP